MMVMESEKLPSRLRVLQWTARLRREGRKKKMRSNVEQRVAIEASTINFRYSRAKTQYPYIFTQDGREFENPNEGRQDRSRCVYYESWDLSILRSADAQIVRWTRGLGPEGTSLFSIPYLGSISSGEEPDDGGVFRTDEHRRSRLS
nr:hypothetical protein Iba_chr14dCG12310 [Ipomoea batatas]